MKHFRTILLHFFWYCLFWWNDHHVIVVTVAAAFLGQSYRVASLTQVPQFLLKNGVHSTNSWDRIHSPLFASPPRRRGSHSDQQTNNNNNIKSNNNIIINSNVNNKHSQWNGNDVVSKQHQRPQRTTSASTSAINIIKNDKNNQAKAWYEVNRRDSYKAINEWIAQQQNDFFLVDDGWTVTDQIEFIKLLQYKGAYKGILSFLEFLDKPNVKVCTTAIFAMALSHQNYPYQHAQHHQRHYRQEAIQILDLMDRCEVLPTSLTFVALLGSIDGPSATTAMMTRFKKYLKQVKMTTEVYNSAIYACCRIPISASSKHRYSIQRRNNNNNSYNEDSNHENNEQDWQVALRLLQQMRSQRIRPTIKTYHAILQVFAKTGKVSLAMSLLQQIKNTPNLQPDETIWAAALNVCAQAGDYQQAINLINEMQHRDNDNNNNDKNIGNGICKPNLRHCTALIKAFAKSKQDQLALRAFEMMTGTTTAAAASAANVANPRTASSTSISFYLPRIDPDLVALNTVIVACAKAQNYQGALSIYERMKTGEFHDPHHNRNNNNNNYSNNNNNNKKIITPDLITHHTMLVACNQPQDARNIVKEMRLSRRSRYGAVPPNNVTYAHAINVCQKAEPPDVEGADIFLTWAKADGIQPSVFMYSSAIWTAQRSGTWQKAVEYFKEMIQSGCYPNGVAYNGYLSSICASNNIKNVMEAYKCMKDSGHELSGATAKRLVNSLSSISNINERQKCLEEVFNLMNTRERTVRIGGPVIEALINLYGSNDCYEKALETFDSIVGLVDKACLRSILLSCAMSRPAKWEDAVSILHTSDIVEGTSGPGKIDQIALGNAILACCKADQFEEGLNLLQLYGLPLYEREIDGVPPIPVVAINALISACGRGGRPDLSLATLNEMQSKFGIKADTRSYRSAVIACNQAEHLNKFLKAKYPQGDYEQYENHVNDTVKWWECALALLRRMQEADLQPDKKIFSSVISACEAAGQWQRALGILQMILDEHDTEENEEISLNLYYFNAAISACEKGGAWLEALELYETMVDRGGPIKPNFITLSSLIVSLEKAGQKDLAQSKYIEGRKMGIVNPWKWTRNSDGVSIRALDLHSFSVAMAKVALRTTLDSCLENQKNEFGGKDLIIITGKGRNSMDQPILKLTTLDLLRSEYQVEGRIDSSNSGRIIVDSSTLSKFIGAKSWV